MVKTKKERKQETTATELFPRNKQNNVDDLDK